MTKEEAFKTIKGEAWLSCQDKWLEAIDFVEKVLFAKPCNDCISRQAVIEMAYNLSEIDGEHFTEPHMVVDVEDIQNAPPVTPAENGFFMDIWQR